MKRLGALIFVLLLALSLPACQGWDWNVHWIGDGNTDTEGDRGLSDTASGQKVAKTIGGEDR